MGSIWDSDDDFEEAQEKDKLPPPKKDDGNDSKGDSSKKDASEMTETEQKMMYYQCKRLFNQMKSQEPAMMNEVWEKMFAEWFENLPLMVWLGIPLWILSPIKALVMLVSEDAKRVPPVGRGGEMKGQGGKGGQGQKGDGKGPNGGGKGQGGKGKGGKGKGKGGKKKEDEDWLTSWWRKGIRQDAKLLMPDWFFTVQSLSFFTADMDDVDFVFYNNIDMFIFYSWATLYVPVAWIIAVLGTVIFSPIYIINWIDDSMSGGPDKKQGGKGKGGKGGKGGKDGDWGNKDGKDGDWGKKD